MSFLFEARPYSLPVKHDEIVHTFETCNGKLEYFHGFVTAKARKSDGLTWVEFEDGERQYVLSTSEYYDKWMLVKKKSIPGSAFAMRGAPARSQA